MTVTFNTISVSCFVLSVISRPVLSNYHFIIPPLHCFSSSAVSAVVTTLIKIVPTKHMMIL